MHLLVIRISVFKYNQNFVAIVECSYLRIIRTGTISMEEKAGNFASHLDLYILVPAMLKFCSLSSESYLHFRYFSLQTKVICPYMAN